MKKFFKIVWNIILVLLLLLAFFAIIRPAYITYKLNKTAVEVDKSGERATSKNKELKEKEKAKAKEKNKSNSSNTEESTFKVEKKEYEAVVFDDRILMYEGNIKSDSMKALIDILIENTEGNTYTKTDVTFNNIEGLENLKITYQNDTKENYKESLNQMKSLISEDKEYTVNFEYNSLRTVVNNIIITQK